MPTLKDIRKRINSVKSTEQITKAMKMVSSAKLMRAQAGLMNARPYRDAMEDVVSRLFAAEAATHPLTEVREGSSSSRLDLIVVTSDRGLCGGFNSNLLRDVLGTIPENQETFKNVILTVVGRKGLEFLSRRDVEIGERYTGVTADMKFARLLGDKFIRDFSAARTDRVVIVFNEFRSLISQKVAYRQLLPIVPGKSAEEGEAFPETIYEPSRKELLETLLPRLIISDIYVALLESQASELAARMTAMDAASTNAAEMISHLTLQYNRARQAAITRELLDIVNGAEALKA
ncbi:ATP synthase F1 subunit gamma [Thermodesulfobacteriota bacterium]